MARCRSCNAEILWCKSVNGKLIPMDSAPSDDGNMVITADSLARTATDEDTTPRFKSHFATCPGAAKHRKK